jgi:hypothetical protein
MIETKGGTKMIPWQQSDKNNMASFSVGDDVLWLRGAGHEEGTIIAIDGNEAWIRVRNTKRYETIRLYLLEHHRH